MWSAGGGVKRRQDDRRDKSEAPRAVEEATDREENSMESAASVASAAAAGCERTVADAGEERAGEAEGAEEGRGGHGGGSPLGKTMILTVRMDSMERSVLLKSVIGSDLTHVLLYLVAELGIRGLRFCSAAQKFLPGQSRYKNSLFPGQAY